MAAALANTAAAQAETEAEVTALNRTELVLTQSQGQPTLEAEQAALLKAVREHRTD